MSLDPIRLAIPSKGHLYDGLIELLKSAGYRIRRASDRQYEATIAGHPRFHVVFMRPGDVITSVSRLAEYREREGRLGLMLFTVIEDVWTNQSGELVKRTRSTVIRY